MTTEKCELRIGDVYLFHPTDPECKSRTSLWGIAAGRSTDGRIRLEASSVDLEKYIFGVFRLRIIVFADSSRVVN